LRNPANKLTPMKTRPPPNLLDGGDKSGQRTQTSAKAGVTQTSNSNTILFSYSPHPSKTFTKIRQRFELFLLADRQTNAG